MVESLIEAKKGKFLAVVRWPMLYYIILYSKLYIRLCIVFYFFIDHQALKLFQTNRTNRTKVAPYKLNCWSYWGPLGDQGQKSPREAKRRERTGRQAKE